VPALRKAEEIRHAIRRAKSTEITDRLSALGDKARISVAVSLLGDRSAFALELGGHEKPADDRLNSIEGVGYHRKRKVALQIAEHMTNTDFVTAVLDQDSGKLTLGPSKFGSGLTRDEAKALIEHFAPLDQDRQYDSARLDALLQLDELHLDDRPLIALDDQDISGLSPGQRCTALLPLILLEGDAPLIIDQPEDNLDNRLIFDVVVDVLRSLKGHRQIICSTHNPNIPVSGDAEQIVVLEAPSRRRGSVRCQSGIDSPEIIDHVKTIMEGGETAFEVRARKYNYDIAKRTVM
jgi:hypothetical protein